MRHSLLLHIKKNYERSGFDQIFAEEIPQQKSHFAHRPKFSKGNPVKER